MGNFEKPLLNGQNEDVSSNNERGERFFSARKKLDDIFGGFFYSDNLDNNQEKYGE